MYAWNGRLAENQATLSGLMKARTELPDKTGNIINFPGV
jgi:hypothetical protein